MYESTVEASSKAARIRVASTAQIVEDDLCDLLAMHISFFRHSEPSDHPYHQWHDRAFASRITLDARELKQTLQLSTTHTPHRNVTTALNNHAKTSQLQKHLTTTLRLLAPTQRQQLHHRLRTRLERWAISVPIGRRADRAFARFAALKGKVKPAVIAVYLRTLLNGWTTSRRMRSLHGGATGPCLLCSAGADSIEHYANCTVLKTEYEKHGILLNGLERFLALDSASYPDDTVRVAKLLADSFTTRNALANSKTALSPQQVFRTAAAVLM